MQIQSIFCNDLTDASLHQVFMACQRYSANFGFYQPFVFSYASSRSKFNPSDRLIKWVVVLKQPSFEACKLVCLRICNISFFKQCDCSRVLNVVRKRNMLTSKKCGEGREETASHKSGLKTFCRLRQRSWKKMYEQQGRNQPRGQMASHHEKAQSPALPAKSLTQISFLASSVCLTLISLFKTTSNIVL